MSSTQPSQRVGLVLAAGYGARQQSPSASPVLKPLIEVVGRTLLSRCLDGLTKAGCRRAIVVVGHEAERITDELDAYRGDLELEWVLNPRFDLQNGVSVLAARDRLPSEFVLTMADHVFDESIMHLVASHSAEPGGGTLLVDSKVASVFDLDDATKVQVRDGRIVEIGKALPRFNAIDCGLFVVGDSLVSALEQEFAQKGDVSLSDGVRVLAHAGRMAALDIGPGRWQDVDTPEMLEAAEALVLSRASAS